MAISVQLELLAVENPVHATVVLGQAHATETVAALHNALACAVPGLAFGLAFCESSGRRLVRKRGTDAALTDLAARNAYAIGAGHAFVLVLGNSDGADSAGILNTVKLVPGVCRLFCATAEPLQVVVAGTGQGRGILGVVDGLAPSGIEVETALQARNACSRSTGRNW
jgi:adenosine/AMP kinase